MQKCSVVWVRLCTSMHVCRQARTWRTRRLTSMILGSVALRMRAVFSLPISIIASIWLSCLMTASRHTELASSSHVQYCLQRWTWLLTGRMNTIAALKHTAHAAGDGGTVVPVLISRSHLLRATQSPPHLALSFIDSLLSIGLHLQAAEEPRQGEQVSQKTRLHRRGKELTH